MDSIYRYASHKSVGKRDYQEDSCEFSLHDSSFPQPDAEDDKPNGKISSALMAVLADGMGGHVGGLEASSTACLSFLDSFEQSEGPIRDRLGGALTSANQAISVRIISDPELEGMGCTLVGIHFDEGGMLWVSIGDSPLYLYRNGKVEQLNEDHSLAPMLASLVASGEMTQEEADNDPQRNSLRSALMGKEIDLVDLPEHISPLQDNDWIILASDGVQTLSPPEMGKVIAATQANGPSAVAQGLVQAVLDVDKPYQDNTTVMAIHHGKSAGEQQSANNSRGYLKLLAALFVLLVALLGAYAWLDLTGGNSGANKASGPDAPLKQIEIEKTPGEGRPATVETGKGSNKDASQTPTKTQNKPKPKTKTEKPVTPKKPEPKTPAKTQSPQTDGPSSGGAATPKGSGSSTGEAAPKALE